MKKKQNKKISTRWIIVIILILTAAFLFFQAQWFVKQNSIKTHVSQDLKISFQYPKDWNIDDRYHTVLLTNYVTSMNRNDHPNSNQIEIMIDRFNVGCHESIEENLKDPACGEGGPTVKPNEIVSKETLQKPGGTFYKYIIKYPSGKQQTFYLLQKTGTDKILQISKEPDPSQFEKEFDEIINSIKFL